MYTGSTVVMGVAPDLVIVLLQLRSVVRVVRCVRDRERERKQRVTLRQDLCATLPSWLVVTSFKPGAPFLSLDLLKNYATTVTKKKKKKMQKVSLVYTVNQKRMPSCTCVQVPVLSWSFSFSAIKLFHTRYRSHPKLKQKKQYIQSWRGGVECVCVCVCVGGVLLSTRCRQ